MADDFRALNRDTPMLLPPSIQEWLPDQHMARFVVETICPPYCGALIISPVDGSSTISCSVVAAAASPSLAGLANAAVVTSANASAIDIIVEAFFIVLLPYVSGTDVPRFWKCQQRWTQWSGGKRSRRGRPFEARMGGGRRGRR